MYHHQATVTPPTFFFFFRSFHRLKHLQPKSITPYHIMKAALAQQKQGVIGWAQSRVNHLILLAVFFIMSIIKNIEFIYHKAYLRFLSLTYNPNKSPQVIRDDVNVLGKIPKRISCIISMRSEDDENGGVDGVIADIAELAAWCTSAGIPSLTIYEETGVVKNHLDQLQRSVAKNLRGYFGLSIPSYNILIPHTNVKVSGGDSSDGSDKDLDIALLSRVDGKPTIVELTKTMSELTANNELSVKDISVKLIDEELCELVGPEPDLLICFDPVLDLHDYPPWHIRLSELYWEADNDSVTYAVFIRALRRFSNCKVNVGK